MRPRAARFLRARPPPRTVEPRDGWRSLLRAFENQRAYSRGYSPLYEALMDEAARAVMPLAADEEPWPEYAPLAALLAEAWQARAFSTPVEPSLLLAGALHRAVLSGAPEAAALRRFFPTAGGAYQPEDREALRAAFLRFWDAPPADAVRFLSEGRVQTNELSRGPAWLFPAAAVGAWLGRPVDLLELGTSAGLLLAADRMAWRWRTPRGTLELPEGAPLLTQTLSVEGDAAALGFPLAGRLPLPRIARRVGVDLHPVDLRDPGERLGLRACVWGDQPDRLERLDGAIATFLALAGPDAPTLQQGDMVEAVLAAAPDAAAGGPRVLLVLNSVAALYLQPEGYARLSVNVARRFAALPPGHAGVWVELETPRPEEGEAPEDKRTVRLTAKVLARDGGGLTRFLLARAEPHPRHWRLFAEAWAGLREALAGQA